MTIQQLQKNTIKISIGVLKLQQAITTLPKELSVEGAMEIRAVHSLQNPITLSNYFQPIPPLSPGAAHVDGKNLRGNRTDCKKT